MNEKIPEIPELQAEMIRLQEEIKALQELDRKLADAAQCIQHGRSDEAEVLLRGVQRSPIDTELARQRKDAAVNLLVEIRLQAELEEGDYQKAALIMWKALRQSPDDPKRWFWWYWAKTQEQMRLRREDRDRQLDRYEKRVDGEAKWWLGLSIVSAVIAFGVFVYAVWRVIGGAVGTELLTPLYAVIPGVVSALFFQQYIDAKRRVDERHAKVWDLYETFEQADMRRADGILMQATGQPLLPASDQISLPQLPIPPTETVEAAE